MSHDSQGQSADRVAAQQRFLSLFLRSEREIFRYVAVLVPNVADNGEPESEHALNIKPPFRVGAAELGNWNAKGFPKNDPFMIRNFGGAMDEFCLFGRALGEEEIRALYSTGRP